MSDSIQTRLAKDSIHTFNGNIFQLVSATPITVKIFAIHPIILLYLSIKVNQLPMGILSKQALQLY